MLVVEELLPSAMAGERSLTRQEYSKASYLAINQITIYTTCEWWLYNSRCSFQRLLFESGDYLRVVSGRANMVAR